MTEGTATLVTTEYKISIAKRKKKKKNQLWTKQTEDFPPTLEWKRKWENMKVESTEEQAKVLGISEEETRRKAKTQKEL